MPDDNLNRNQNPPGTPDAQGQAQVDPHKLRIYYQRAKDDQRLMPGIAASLAGAAVGAIAWGAVTALFNMQFGIMALAVGFLAGFGLRKAGPGIDKQFGIAAAVIALFGCVAGNALTICIEISQASDIGILDVINNMTFDIMVDWMKQTFGVFDLFFYGIAVYYGYISSFRKMTPEEMRQVMK